MVKVRVNFGRLSAGKKVKLYVVKNTSRKYLYVLAEDEKTALSIAWSANHIYSTILEYSLDNSRAVWAVNNQPGELINHWNLIQKAIAQRVQGTIEINDNIFSVGDEIFS